MHVKYYSYYTTSIKTTTDADYDCVWCCKESRSSQKLQETSFNIFSRLFLLYTFTEHEHCLKNKDFYILVTFCFKSFFFLVFLG